MHADARVVDPYFPASHGEQEALVECAYVPASQDTQVSDDVAPKAMEKEPAGHSRHSDDAEDVEPLGPYLPASHGEPEHARTPCVAEYVPAAQFVQLGAPSVAEYVPAVQFVHSVAAATALHVPVKPLSVAEPSDVKVTLRKPVVDV
jgi:hypothetical protein